MTELKKRFSSQISSVTPTRIKEFASRAAQLDQVLKDIRSREFMQNPTIQELVKKVKRQAARGKRAITPSFKRSHPTPSHEITKSSAERKSKGMANRRWKALESQVLPQVPYDMILNIMKKADEIRASYWNSGSSTHAGLVPLQGEEVLGRNPDRSGEPSTRVSSKRNRLSTKVLLKSETKKASKASRKKS